MQVVRKTEVVVRWIEESFYTGYAILKVKKKTAELLGCIEGQSISINGVIDVSKGDGFKYLRINKCNVRVVDGKLFIFGNGVLLK